MHTNPAMFAVVDPKLAWYVSRASGFVTWLLCAAAIMWGLMLSSKRIRRRGLPAWLLDLHKFLGTLALVFCGIHLAGLAADNYVAFGWSDLFVPMAAKWKPGPVAWGIAAFYLLVAVQVTSWMKSRIPKRVWHGVHLSSLAMFAAGTVHGIQAGTDWTNRIVQFGAVVVSAQVLAMLIMRIVHRRATAKPASERIQRPTAAQSPTPRVPAPQ